MTNQPTKKISSRFIYFFGAFGGILFGYDIGVMTGALPFLQKDWHLTDAGTIGWITSSLMLGAIVGGALAGQLSDKLGRRRMILAASFVFAIGSVMAGISPNDGVAWLLIARTLLGLAAVPAVILFLGVLRLPESPGFLVKTGHIDAARRVLTYIRPSNEVAGELADIQRTVAVEDGAQKNITLATLFSSKYRYLVTAGIGVAAFQQFMGANAIFYYIPLIVEKATGQSAASALLWPIVQGVILVLGAILYMVIADKFKRRTLLMLGGTIMALSFLMPAILNMVVGAENLPPMLIVVFLSIFVAFYSFTWAPLTWVLVGEIFPLAIRGRAGGLASAFNWIGSFAVGLLFPIMTAMMPQASVFAIFGVISIIAVLFVKFAVPETHGKSLEEIEAQGTR